MLRQSGLSLIELMVALALGVILLLGLIEIFGSVRASFNAAEARARIQESGRFSLEFLRRDVRMAGHMGCQNEFYYFPQTANRVMEPPENGAVDRGFYNHLVQPRANSIKDNAPYVTQLNRPIEIYDFNGTAPGDGAYALGATLAPSGNPGDWTPNAPDAGLANISSRAVPGSDILVVRYLDETPVPVAPVAGVQSVNSTTGLIQLTAADAASVQQFALYGMTQCSINALFQVAAKPSATVISALGGLNIPRQGGFVFDNSTGTFSAGSLIYRYRFYAYYIGVNAATGIPGLYRQSLIAQPTAAAQGIQFAPAQELVEGVEMMQIMVGADTDVPREDFVNAYRSPDVQVVGGTPAAIDADLRAVSSVRISLLIRSNTFATGAVRAVNTIPVGGVNITLPADNRARQTYDMTTVIRNRVRT